MALYDWLKFLHVLVAMIWVGGLVALVVLGTHARRSGDAARFVGSLRVLGPLVLGPSAALLVAFGIWLVVDSGAWSFGQTWVWLALVLVAAAVAVGAGFLARVGIAAERAVEAGDTAAVDRHVARWSLGIVAILALLVAAT